MLALACLGVVWPVSASPAEDAGDANQPAFEDYRIPGTNNYIRLEKLWERDLSDYAVDANENNHNMFVEGNTVYCYVEHFGGGTSRSIILRRFDAGTGVSLPDITSPYPINSGGNTQLMVQGDGNGNLIIAGIQPNANLSRGRLNLSVGTYSCDEAGGLQPVGDPIVYERTTGADEASYNYYSGAFEWLDMARSDDGTYRLTVGGWHYYGRYPDDNTPFYPGRLQFSCSPDASEPEIMSLHYTPQETYGLNSGNREWNSNSSCKGLLFSRVLSNGRHLVQGFGKSVDEKTAHTAVMLYGKGEGASEEAPLEFIDALDEPALSFRDAHCFGAFPVTLDSESLLVLPYQYNEAAGTQFKIARWDQNSFSSLKELWTFPEEGVFPRMGDIYDFQRPKVVAVRNGAAQSQRSQSAVSTNIYAYMPGSGLGAYRLSLYSATTTGVDDIPAPANTVQATLAVSDKHLKITLSEGLPEGTVYPVRIHTTSGQLCGHYEVGMGKCLDIDLTSLPAGIYLVTVGDDCYRIAIP